MQIFLDKNFAERIRRLEWEDIQYGISRNWMAVQVGIDFALMRISQGSDNQQEIELAGMSSSNEMEIRSQVSKLAAGRKIEIMKWTNIALTWGFENRQKLADPLLFLEEVYAEFDYPPTISHLVRYMPSEGPAKDMMLEWQKYLDREVYSQLIVNLA